MIRNRIVFQRRESARDNLTFSEMLTVQDAPDRLSDPYRGLRYLRFDKHFSNGMSQETFPILYPQLNPVLLVRIKKLTGESIGSEHGEHGKDRGKSGRR
jgi:hypothetical protein